MSAVDPTTAAHPALWDMALIHRIFRSSFTELARLVTEVQASDAARVSAVADHLGFTLAGLTAHHTTEDDLVWPVLLERARPSAALVERMEEQHHGLHTGIEEVRRLTDVWRADPSPDVAGELSTAITGMFGKLTTHLDEEERDVVPLIAEHLSVAEWHHFGKTAFDKFTPAQRFTAMGQMLEVASPAEAAAMLAPLPAPIKVLWRLVGRRRYRQYAEAFRGTPAAAARS
ncbi:MAG: hemerythrin domain-containing protein [Chloroflexi bacterium]|nr:hemerythrin domain-containing protein [Chloroflexota bacterium]